MGVRFGRWILCGRSCRILLYLRCQPGASAARRASLGLGLQDVRGLGVKVDGFALTNPSLQDRVVTRIRLSGGPGFREVRHHSEAGGRRRRAQLV